MEESITAPMAKEKGKGKSSKPRSRGGRVGIEDFALPRRLVRRLARGVLPPNNYIATDALLAISKSATVFISFIADEANQQIQQKNKKTITPVEVIAALREQGYENFVDRVEAEVNKHIAIAGDRRKIYRKKAADKAQNINSNDSALSVGSGNTNTSVDQLVGLDGNAGTSTLSVVIQQTPTAGDRGSGLQFGDHEGEEDEADGSGEDSPPAKKARMSTSNTSPGEDDETENEGLGDEDNHEGGLADDDEDKDDDDDEVESDDEEEAEDGGNDDSLEEEHEGEEEEIDEAVADIDSD